MIKASWSWNTTRWHRSCPAWHQTITWTLLTYHQKCSEAFTYEQFYNNVMNLIPNVPSEITLKITPASPRDQWVNTLLVIQFHTGTTARRCWGMSLIDAPSPPAFYIAMISIVLVYPIYGMTIISMGSVFTSRGLAVSGTEGTPIIAHSLHHDYNLYSARASYAHISSHCS